MWTLSSKVSAFRASRPSTDGPTALALAKEHRPDLLVTDVGLPGMDGFELVRRFRDLPGHRLTPSIVVTAYGTIDDRLAGFHAGAVDYVTKLREVSMDIDNRVETPVDCSGPFVVQILMNLLGNAAYAAGTGGRVQVEAFTENGNAVVHVIDSGCGIPLDQRERVFDPFFTTKAPGEGTGLGLTTSRRLAQQHDGDLRVVDVGDAVALRLELPMRRCIVPLVKDESEAAS